MNNQRIKLLIVAGAIVLLPLATSTNVLASEVTKECVTNLGAELNNSNVQIDENSKTITVTLDYGDTLLNVLETINTTGLDTIKVITINNKELNSSDYYKLKQLKIANIDLSQSYSTSIPNNAFSIDPSSDGWLKSITIPNEVKTIGKYAFLNCRNLTNVTLPDSLELINEGAFQNTGINNINLPNSLTSIGLCSFAGCRNLESINLPNSLTQIDIGAFEGSGLKRIEIPSSITSISPHLFIDCEYLEEVILPDTLEIIGENAFRECSNLKNIEIPNSVTTIDSFAFHSSGLTKITIPDSVTSIEPYTFGICHQLEEVILPDTLEIIGENAFRECSNLKNIEIPNSVTTIGAEAFDTSGLTEINIPNSVESIHTRAFAVCKNLKILTIPTSVKSVGKYAVAFSSEDVQIFIAIDENDMSSSLRFNNIKSGLDSRVSNIILDVPFNMSISNTSWINNYKIAQPSLKYFNGDKYLGNISNESVYLNISSPYQSENITITKDGQPYQLPNLTDSGYEFHESGNYKIELITDAYVVSSMEIKIVDKFLLETLVETIESSDKYVEDKWTSESWNTLLIALMEAKSVLNNNDATQDKVDNAFNLLNEAFEGLIEKDPSLPEVDKSELEELYNSLVDKYNESDYTSSSWKRLKKSLDNAQSILLDKDATVNEIDFAVKELKKANAKLKEIKY